MDSDLKIDPPVIIVAADGSATRAWLIDGRIVRKVDPFKADELAEWAGMWCAITSQSAGVLANDAAYLRKQRKAHSLVKSAVDKGDLVRPSRCPICGREDKRIVAHHDDYNKPLDVQWMCEVCHHRQHALDARDT